MKVEIVHLTYYQFGGAQGTELLYLRDRVPMLARWPFKTTAILAVEMLDVIREKTNGTAKN